MNYVSVNEVNLNTLYEINRQLAVEENQANLFIADINDYAKGFIGPSPIAYGTLAYQDDKLIGFSICNYKFATYLGHPALYIEDIYLKKDYCTETNKRDFLNYLITLGLENGCSRIEMRVMRSTNWRTDLLKSLGFENIDKWSVYKLTK